MAEADLFSSVRRHYAELTDGLKKVADYIAVHYQDLAFLSARSLAMKIGVSESQVVRCAMALGYDGYPELQRQAQLLVRSRLAPSTKLASRKTKGAAEADEVLRAMLRRDIANLENMLNTDLNFPAFGELVTAVRRAERVYIVGARGLTALVRLLGFLLSFCRGNVRALPLDGGADALEEIAHIQPSDLLIAFCFARYARVTIHAIEVARKAGAKTVGITDSVTCPAARAADLALVCATQTDSFFNSYVSAVSLINALAICLANLDESTVLERLRKVDEALPDDWFC